MKELQATLELVAPTRPLQVNQARCIRTRSSRVSCSRCAEACPEGALQLGRGVEVAPECAGCGLCTVSCGTGALTLKTPWAKRLLMASGKGTRGSRVVACDRENAQLLPADALTVPCLGILRVELLAYLAASGDAPLLVQRGLKCDNCAKRDISDRLLGAALGAVNELYPGRVLLKDLPSKERAAPQTWTPKDDRPDSRERREFLSGFFSLAGRLLGRHFPTPDEPGREFLPSDPLGLLTDAFRLRPPVAGALLPLGMLDCAPDCLLCPACSSLCPSGALRLEVSGERADLFWQPDRCYGCGSCRAVCPTAALGTRGQVSAACFMRRSEQLLARGENRSCSCGEMYRQVRGGPTRCLGCRVQSRSSKPKSSREPGNLDLLGNGQPFGPSLLASE